MPFVLGLGSVLTKEPAASDNTMLWIVIACVLGAALLLVLIRRAVSGRQTDKASAQTASAQSAPQANGIPAEVVAAIAAALQAMLDAEGHTGGYIIRSIRRVPAWNNAARNEQQKRLV